jgi:DNA polymerase III sliding clamp (beta) subunit (PCNA family)
MRFEINRLLMLEAAKSAAKVAPTNATSDVLNGVLVEGNEDTGEVFLTATNHKVSIQHKVRASVGESGIMLVNSRLLVGMMSKLEGEYVSLASDAPNLLKVTGGRCKYEIFCHSPESYPKPVMPFPEESVIMTGICSLAKRTTYFVSTDNSKPALQCVQVKFKNNAVLAAATDGMKMMLAKGSAEPTGDREFLLPGHSLQTLASVSSDSDVFEVGDIGQEVVFVRGDMIFTIRKLVTDNFIDTNKIINNLKPAYSAMVEASKMEEALALIEIGTLAGSIRVPANLVFAKGEIILSCENDSSEVKSVVPANISHDTPDTGFFYDASAMLKLFQIVGGKVKLEIDARGFMLIKTRNEAYFQSPLRESRKSVKEPGTDGSQSEQGQDKKQKRAKGAKDVKKAA